MILYIYSPFHKRLKFKYDNTFCSNIQWCQEKQKTEKNLKILLLILTTIKEFDCKKI